MNKAFYPIFKYKKRPQYFLLKEEVPRYIKIWAYNDYVKRHSGELSEIITGTNLVLEESLSRKFNLIQINGRTEQVQLTGKNLFNKNDVQNGKYIEASTGDVLDLGTASASNFINIENISTLIISGDTSSRINEGAFYNSNKEYISGFNSSAIYSGINVPNGASYIRITVTTNLLNDVQLEEGSTATSYEPYCRRNPCTKSTDMNVLLKM